jgi:hypothetical protein
VAELPVGRGGALSLPRLGATKIVYVCVRCIPAFVSMERRKVVTSWAVWNLGRLPESLQVSKRLSARLTEP